MDEPFSKAQIDTLIARYGKMATLSDVEQGEAQRRGEVPYCTRYISHRSAMEALRSLEVPDGILPTILPSSGGSSYQQWQLQLCPAVKAGERATTAVYSGDYPNGAWVIKSGTGKPERFTDLSAVIDYLKAHPTADLPKLDKPKATAYNPLGDG